MTVRRLGPALVVAVLLPALAGAQSVTPDWRPGHLVVSLGGGWIGADGLGDVTAASRAAAVGTTSPAAFNLFKTESTLGGAPRAELGLGVAVTPALAVEAFGTLARPTLETRISGDLEGGADTTASDRVDEYTVGGRLTYEIARVTWARRARPYVAAGGAYLRQLHQDRVLVETGQMWTASGGVRLFLRGGGPRRARPLGLATELGWAWRTGGISFRSGARSMPTAQVRLFAAF